MGEVGTGTSGTRFISKNYPVEEGLILDTTKLKDNYILKPSVSKVPKKDRTGI